MSTEKCVVCRRILLKNEFMESRSLRVKIALSAQYRSLRKSYPHTFPIIGIARGVLTCTLLTYFEAQKRKRKERRLVAKGRGDRNENAVIRTQMGQLDMLIGNSMQGNVKGESKGALILHSM